MNDPVIIIGTTELRRYQRLAKLWWAGWVMAGLATLLLAWALGKARAYQNAVHDVHALARELDEVREVQVKTTTAFTQAWENQQQAIDLVAEAANQIRNRQQMAEYNRNAVVDLRKKRP